MNKDLIVAVHGSWSLDGPYPERGELGGTLSSYPDGNDPPIAPSILGVVAFHPILEFSLAEGAAVEILAAHVYHHSTAVDCLYDVLLYRHASNEVGQVDEDFIPSLLERVIEDSLCELLVFISE